MSQRFRSLVLCYHAVSDDWDHVLSVRPAALERQVKLMLGRRFRPVAADEVFGRGRLLHITFDDAFRSVVGVLPMLERLQVPVTIFACPGYADTGGVLALPELRDEAQKQASELETMDWDTLRGLVERGIEVGSHTTSHAHLTALSDHELALELRESRDRLESELGRRCRFLAYPYGEHDRRVRTAARSSGYELAFALPGRTKPVDTFALPRIGIWRGDGLQRVMLKTSVARHAISAIRGSI